MINLTDLAKSSLRFISKNSSIILTVTSVLGVATTIACAGNATLKAMSLIDAAAMNKYQRTDTKESFGDWIGAGGANDEPEDNDRLRYELLLEAKMLTKKELIATTWKCYIPTAISGIATMACIIGLNSVHTRRHAALASLYTLSEAALKEYQAKVVETLGKSKELKIRDDISKDAITNNPPKPSEIIFTGKGDTLCYDSMSGRYFKTDIEKIRRIQNELNRQLMSDMFISLNEFYDEIGLSHIRLGEEKGWEIDKGLIDISFSSQLTEDGTPCLVLNYEVVPRYRG